MTNYNLLVKQKEYSGVRSLIVATQSGLTSTYFAEGGGQRYYINQISSTASAVLQAASFETFLSFTMSGTATFSMQMVPMAPGQSVLIDMSVIALNSNGTKGYAEKLMTSYRHSGATLTKIGQIQSTRISDFSSVYATFSTTGTQSVNLICYGQSGELIDFDIFINYKKSYHAIQNISGGQSITPIYPSS